MSTWQINGNDGDDDDDDVVVDDDDDDDDDSAENVLSTSKTAVFVNSACVELSLS